MMASPNSNYLYISENDLRNKLLTQEQTNMFIQFIDSIKGDNELKNEIKYLIDDYNKVLFSAIHLIQETKNNLINVNDNMESKSFTNNPSEVYHSKDKNYSTMTNFSSSNLNFKHYPIEESKYSFVNTKPTKIEEQNYIERENDYRAYTSENSEGNSLPKFDSNLIKIKKTNEILKRIDQTLENQKYFSAKYTNMNDYKLFLDNLINYKYSLSELNDIKKDIEKFEGYRPNPLGLSPSRITKEESVYDFDKSLRRYPDSKKDLEYLNKPPFIRFTNKYGDYFDKSLKRVSSPMRHKPIFE